MFAKGVTILLTKQQQIMLELKTILKAIVCLFKEPNNLDYIYNLEDGLLNTKATSLAVDWLKSQHEVAQLIQERYIAPYPDIEALLQYPEESLGYIYASYIKKANFDPRFYRDIKVENDTSYVILRIRQTHDIWHIITGFNTDRLGEIGLKAFELAQTRRNLAVVLVGGSLLTTLIKSPELLYDLLEKIVIGYKMGSHSKPLLAQKWEEGWNKPLSEWRKQLEIEPISI